jgi:hypothetical protein
MIAQIVENCLPAAFAIDRPPRRYGPGSFDVAAADLDRSEACVVRRFPRKRDELGVRCRASDCSERGDVHERDHERDCRASYPGNVKALGMSPWSTVHEEGPEWRSGTRAPLFRAWRAGSGL